MYAMTEPSPEFSFVGPGDVDEIVTLFERSFARTMTGDYYGWQFLESAAGGARSVVARVGGRIVSHAGYSARACRLAGDEGLLFAKHTSMTDPDWRGRGIYSRLLTWAHERLAETGAGLVLSWPNPMNHCIQIARDDYHDIRQITVLRRDPSSVLSPKDPPFPSTPERFGGGYDGLGRATPGSASFTYLRSAGYLSWRYSDRPDVDYFLVEERESGELRSAVVCKLYPAKEPMRIMVVEWLSRPGQPEADRPFRRLEEFSEEAGLPILLWQNVHDRTRHRLLEKRGYVPAEPVTYFGAFPIGGECPEGFSDFANWYVSMGDVDVF